MGELEPCLSQPDSLLPVRDDATQAAMGADASVPPVGDADITAGPARYRDQTNTVSVYEPFLRCPAALELAFDPELLRIATAYYRCPAAVTGADLRRSFVNDLPGFGDLYNFHSDPNSVRELKSFTYLNDVDELGGPFLYVRGSHRLRPPGWTAKYLWSRAEVEDRFGEDRICAVTGQAGDVILADTSGFHTGSKPIARDRSILVVNRFVHKELQGRHPWLHVPDGWIEQLDPQQRHAADYLRVSRSISSHDRHGSSGGVGGL